MKPLPLWRQKRDRFRSSGRCLLWLWRNRYKGCCWRFQVDGCLITIDQVTAGAAAELAAHLENEGMAKCLRIVTAYRAAEPFLAFSSSLYNDAYLDDIIDGKKREYYSSNACSRSGRKNVAQVKI
jgi:hypothetical protein